MRRAIWSAIVPAALALAGCGDAGEEPAAVPTGAATRPAAGGGEASWNDPEAPSGIAVSDGRMTLPAVAGNPGAVYFTIRNSGQADQAIRSAWVAGAEMAMLHVTRSSGGEARMGMANEVPLPAGATVSFAPGGLHVMAMDVSETLEEGGETEVTLTFTSGDKVSFPAEIRAPGDGERAGAGG